MTGHREDRLAVVGARWATGPAGDGWIPWADLEHDEQAAVAAAFRGRFRRPPTSAQIVAQPVSGRSDGE